MPEVSRHEPGSFCWAELATTDDGAAKKFYAALFDWGYEDSPAGPDMVYSMLKKGAGASAPCTRWGRRSKACRPTGTPTSASPRRTTRRGRQRSSAARC